MKQTLLALLSFILLSNPIAVTAQQQSGDFTYTENNGAIAIIGYTGAGGAITIPSTINDIPVTSIGTEAFYDVTTLTGVTIPSSVTSIGDEAFAYCYGLSSVTIPTGVISIGQGAFMDCAMTSVTIPSSVSSISGYPFGECFQLTAINVDPANLSYSSANGVLFDHSQATLLECPPGLVGSYTVPSSVTTIGEDGFAECYFLTDITIPSSVTSIGLWAFFDCWGMLAINVDSGNLTYSSANGVLFDKAQTTLLQFPAANTGSYSIPGTVTSIADYAFEEAHITSVTIPQGVTTIGNGSFEGSSLTILIVPSSVTSIGDSAFAGCASLGSAYFDDNAPLTGSDVFDGVSLLLDVIYYWPGTTGWGTTFCGIPTAVSPVAVSPSRSTVSASPASVTADGSSSSTITVALKNGYGNPVRGITVTLAGSGGSSTISAASGVSDVNGLVTFTVQDTVVETTTYTATDTSDSDLVITATATVSFTAGPASAVASTVSASPGSVTADGATPSTITVTLKDAHNNLVSGKTVTLAKTSGAGAPVITTIQGTSSASGVATFSVTSTRAASDVFTATDSTDGVTVAQTAGVTFTVGAPSGYQITANSDTPLAGAADALSISLVDAFGNTVSSFTGNKTLTFSGLGKSPAGNTPTVSDQAGTPQTLGTPETIAFVSGVGSASLLAYNAEGPVTLAASDGALSTSSAGGAGVVLRVSSTGTQSAYRITGGATPTVGQAEGLTIAAVDSYGNTETSVSGDKNLTFSGLDAAPDGTAPTVTDKGGTAQTLGTAEAITFASGVSSAGGSLMAYKAEGPVTLAVQDDAKPTALASSSVGGAGLSLTVSAGAVSALGSTVSANPASVTADGSSSSAITVTLLDAHNNPVSGKTVALGSSGGSSTVSAASGPSDSSGVVSFTVRDTVAETTTYTATDTSDSGLVITATATVSFTAGPVSAVVSTVSASPGSATADGATPSTITVTLKDAEGNPVSGKTVTLAMTSGAGTPVITTIQGTSSASGVATFSVTSTRAAVDVFAATDSTDGVTVAQTAGVTFTAGAPSAAYSAISPATASKAPDGVSTQVITVQARDVNDNNLSAGGGTVVFSATAGTMGSVTDHGDGTYTATWTAPSSAGTGSATVTATLNGAAVGTAVGASSCVILLPFPQLVSMDGTDGPIVLTWSVVPGGTYQPQYSNTLPGASWTNLGGVITAISSTMTITDDSGTAQGFYRLVQISIP